MKQFYPDAGYTTITEGALLFMKILEEPLDDKVILEQRKNMLRDKAKRGQLGGKRYKKKMFQVRTDQVIGMAEKMKGERLDYFDFLEENKKESAATTANSATDSMSKTIQTLMLLNSDGIIDNATTIEGVKTILMKQEQQQSQKYLHS